MERWSATAIVVAIVGPILTWLIARRKVAIDESAVVFQRWKDLTDRMEQMASNHAVEMRDLREELRIERAENALLRNRVKELEDEVAGLKRQIIQNSQSGAFLINRKEGRDGH